MALGVRALIACLLAFGLAASLAAINLHLAVAAYATAPTSSSAAPDRPTPERLIVGEPITIPGALFAANVPGSRALVTPAQSEAVATAMWQAWDKALIDDDTRALTQLISPGPMLQGTLNNCAYPVGKCVQETQVRPIQWLNTVVPVQTSYPIYFLAEIRTSQYVNGSNNLNSWQPWLELQILTKASPSSSWVLSFDTGYNAANGGSAGLLPFDEGGFPDDPEALGDFNQDDPADQTPSPPYPSAQFLSLLAAYWNSFAETGQAPKPSAFVDNGDTSGLGQALASFAEGTDFAGHRQYTSFSVDPNLPSWDFLANGGYPMVCGSVIETDTDKSIGSDLMYQNDDESNFGIGLEPGLYNNIVDEDAHDTCVYVVNGGLDNAGFDEFAYATTGTRVSSAPSPKSSSELSDVKTALGVLGYEGEQFVKQQEKCQRKGSKSCSQTLSTQLSGQFAQFSRTLTDYRFPSQDQTTVNALDATSAQISQLFQRASANATKFDQLSPQIGSELTQFQSQAGTLLHDVS
jgi:hypothetical protein